MDSYTLREEQSSLLKNVSELKHKIEYGDRRIKELHIEEMKYLEEIPVYKRRSEDAKNNYLKLESQAIPLKKELELLIDELNKVRELVVEEEKALREIREAGHSLEKECAIKKSEILQLESVIKNRENRVYERENDCSSRELLNNKIESDLDKRDVELKNKKYDLSVSSMDIKNSIRNYEDNLEIYYKNVDSIKEQRKFLEEDKQSVKDKLGKADKLVKDNASLKASLLLQADKMSNAVKAAESKQIMLDKALNELTNQENTLKIKDLKIRKMAHEAGLQRELKELEESLK